MDWPGKCETCDGTGNVQEFRSGIGVNMDVRLVKCPACKDGERDLEADEAAEYLKAAGWEWDNCYGKAGEICIMGWLRAGDLGDRYLIGEGRNRSDLTYALNAACRVVRSKGSTPAEMGAR